MDKTEARVHALRLAIKHYEGHNVSDIDMELQADKFYNYITTGRMSNRGY